MTILAKSTAALVLVVAAGGAAMAESDISSVRSLPVPSVSILPGQIITEDQLTSRVFRTSPGSLLGVAVDRSDILGKQANRRLPAGRPVALAMVGQPLLVRRGAPTTATYVDIGFTIAVAVTSLEDGAEDDIIQVRSTDTGAVMKARVLADGSVLVARE